MHKKTILLWVATLGLTLAACGKTATQNPASSPKPATQKVLAQTDNTWQGTKYLSINVSKKGQLGKRNLQQQGAGLVTVSHGGKLDLGQAQQSYAAFKYQSSLNQVGATGKTKQYTLAQLNANLKAAHAGIKLTKISDLVFFKGNRLGYVVHKNKLYALALSYNYGTTGANDALYLYTRSGLTAPKKHLTDAQLNGRWSPLDTQESDASVLVQDGMLYRSENNGMFVFRTRVQDLRKLPAKQLYTTQFLSVLGTAANSGYAMPKATTRGANTNEYTYLFLTPTKMVKIGNGSVQTFTKSASTYSTIPAAFVHTLAQTANYKGLVPAVINQTGTNYFVGYYNTINGLTEAWLQNSTQTKTVDAQGKLVK